MIASAARPSTPAAWAAFWRILVRFQADKVSPWLALRNTIGVVLPLAAGAALGSVPLGLAMSTGALNVSYSDSHEPHIVRARRMLAASFLVAIAVFAGGCFGRNHALMVPLTAVWAFVGGMLVALGPGVADLGVLSMVTLVVFAAFPMSAEAAMYSGLLALLGGLLQTFLALISWPFRRYAAIRRAIGEFYLELARNAAAPLEVTQAPPASEQSTAAQDSLTSLDREHSIEGERFRLLLRQAERLRLGLLALRRYRGRMVREHPEAAEGAIVNRYFGICARLLGTIGNSLLSGETAKAAPECLQSLDELTEALREYRGEALPGSTASLESMPSLERTASPERTAMTLEASAQMAAVTGQLRSAADMAAFYTPSGREAFERREAKTPASLRLSGALATLRANLRPESAAFRHATRLAVCVAIGDAIARFAGLGRPYWFPMTVAIVLKPDFTATFSRGVLRLAGTLAGILLATGLFYALPRAIAAQVALAGTLTFVLRCLGPANYGIFVTAITALIVILVALLRADDPYAVMAARGVNTAAGGAVALLAYWLWPTWERTQVAETLARMLDAYRLYFRAIRECYLGQDALGPHELDRTRIAARLARSNLEASIDRLSAEPGTPPESLSLLGAMQASSHRFVHAAMALEAGLSARNPGSEGEAFERFANAVELTVYYLAAALRGSPIDSGVLPLLRERHHALIHSGDSAVLRTNGRYDLVVIETDRITNSLNTLSEELLRWTRLSRRE